MKSDEAIKFKFKFGRKYDLKRKNDLAAKIQKCVQRLPGDQQKEFKNYFSNNVYAYEKFINKNDKGLIEIEAEKVGQICHRLGVDYGFLIDSDKAEGLIRSVKLGKFKNGIVLCESVTKMTVQEKMRYETFVKQIKERMKERNFSTQKGFANMAGLGESYFSDLTHYKKTKVSREKLIKICGTLYCTADYLMGLANNPEKIVEQICKDGRQMFSYGSENIRTKFVSAVRKRMKELGIDDEAMKAELRINPTTYNKYLGESYGEVTIPEDYIKIIAKKLSWSVDELEQNCGYCFDRGKVKGKQLLPVFDFVGEQPFTQWVYKAMQNGEINDEVYTLLQKLVRLFNDAGNEDKKKIIKDILK